MHLSTNNNTSELMNQVSNYHYVTNVTSFDRQFLHWSFIVLEVAAILTIVVGDISMLMLFFTRKLLGQSTNILVFSVAIGDLVNGILTFPLAMLQKIMYEPSEFMCKGYFYFANVSKTAVAYTILLLAMERIAAVLNCTYRILPPGRCLFFASLTWFFSASYNIWSVVIYDMETVRIRVDVSDHILIEGFSICFASSRFMYLHEIFEYLNPLVTFVFPVISSSLLFFGFWLKKREGDKPGRPYKSSKSVVIFTFALLVSFLATHFPWEIANLVFVHDAQYHTIRELVVLKVLHIITFSRGFWDIFIFGAFRRYVCKKEKALAHFREQRSLHVQRSSLSIPITEQPASLSLLDSDPSVSRRYSSDVTISRRPSAMDGISVCEGEEHHVNTLHNGEQQQGIHMAQFPLRRKSTTITTTTISENYLIPRSPCRSDHTTRRLSFAPPSFSSSNDFPKSVDELGIPKGRRSSSRNTSLLDVTSSPASSSDSCRHYNLMTPVVENKRAGAASTADKSPTPSTFSSSSLLPPSSLSSSQSTTTTTTTAAAAAAKTAIIVGSKSTNSLTAATLHVNPRSTLSPPSLSPQKSKSCHSLKVTDRKRKKSCSFKNIDNIANYSSSSIDHEEIKKSCKTSETLENADDNSAIADSSNVRGKYGRKLSLFLETTFDLTATSPTTTAAVTRDSVENALTICENDL